MKLYIIFSFSYIQRLLHHCRTINPSELPKNSKRAVCHQLMVITPSKRTNMGQTQTTQCHVSTTPQKKHFVDPRSPIYGKKRTPLKHKIVTNENTAGSNTSNRSEHTNDFVLEI